MEAVQAAVEQACQQLQVPIHLVPPLLVNLHAQRICATCTHPCASAQPASAGRWGGAAITPAEATRPGGAQPFAAPHLEAHTAATVCAVLWLRPTQAPPLSLLAGAASQAQLLVSWRQIEAPSSSDRPEFGPSKP